MTILNVKSASAVVKKRNMLNKYMNTKHNDCKCKICYKVFLNSMDALLHTAYEHTNNIIEEYRNSQKRNNILE